MVLPGAGAAHHYLLSAEYCVSVLELPYQMTSNWVAERIEIHPLIVLGARNLKSRCQHDSGPSEGAREGSFLPLLASGGSRHSSAWGHIPRPRPHSLPLSSHNLPPLSISLFSLLGPS